MASKPPPKKEPSAVERMAAACKEVDEVTPPPTNPDDPQRPLRLVRELQKLTIRPKRGGKCKLVFDKDHKAQKRLVAKVVKLRKEAEKAYRNGQPWRPVRLIVLKRRQLGSTTLCMAILYILTRDLEQRSGQLVAHRKGTARKNWNMVKRFYQFDEDRKPLEGERPTKDGLEYTPGWGSECNILTAGGSNVGHGETTQYNVWTEFSRWPNQEEALDGLMHVVPDPVETWDSIIIIETTANGSGNLFHQMWDDAQANEGGEYSDWVPVFLGWKGDPLCQIEIGPNEVFVLDDEEQRFADTYGVDLEQMKWARKTRRDKCRNNWDKFNEQYPISPEVAFMFSGFPVFDLAIVQEMLTSAPTVAWQGDIQIGPGDEFIPELVEQKNGPLIIHKMPETEKTYSLGIDTSDGRKQDWSVMKMMCDQDDEEVASYRSNTLYPTNAGIKAMLLGQLYNYAFMGIERTESGSTALSVCEFGLKVNEDKGWPDIPPYPNLYYDTRKDKKTEEITRTLGFTTSAKSKKRIIGRLSEAIGERELLVHTKGTLVQMSGFVNDPNAVGKKRWKQTKRDPQTELPNDDDIMALAIAWEMKNTTNRLQYAPTKAKVASW